ncbi:hypothetical protein FHX42_003869 [Saccharopolyspora lacisalsi]|uniref:Uncharacterized protein n=1 Tax=Halosaccharopolyspora lacisalsi TaxID=1000566 RepID=A0A839DZP9_9PSEU|nr:hypothetical protein [Halosaccharopolyspora lacisalsi]
MPFEPDPELKPAFEAFAELGIQPPLGATGGRFGS